MADTTDIFTHRNRARITVLVLFATLNYMLAVALAAVRFTRQPQALVSALEKLAADHTEVTSVTRATAPLWVEFPAKVVKGSSSKAARQLAKELLLAERIDARREIAGLAPADGAR